MAHVLPIPRGRHDQDFCGAELTSALLCSRLLLCPQRYFEVTSPVGVTARWGTTDGRLCAPDQSFELASSLTVNRSARA